MARIEAKSKQEAWEIVNELFPTDYALDEQSSERAGYPTYRSSVEFYDYICDLGNRLEINLSTNKTINVWIVEEQKSEVPELPTEGEIYAVAAHQYTFEPERVQLVRVFVSGYTFESKANQSVYKAMYNVDKSWRNSIAGDVVAAYCENKGIEWGSIRVISINHYENKSGGHFVIEAIVATKTMA